MAIRSDEFCERDSRSACCHEVNVFFAAGTGVSIGSLTSGRFGSGVACAGAVSGAAAGGGGGAAPGLAGWAAAETGNASTSRLSAGSRRRFMTSTDSGKGRWRKARAARFFAGSAVFRQGRLGVRRPGTLEPGAQELLDLIGIVLEGSAEDAARLRDAADPRERVGERRRDLRLSRFGTVGNGQ